MKNLIVIFSFILFSTTIISAQEPMSFGIKGGLSLTNLSSDYFHENNARTGFHLGLLGEIPFSDKFSLQPEILYATQGTEADILTLGREPIKTEINLDYIQVPLLAKVHLIKALSIEAGPSFNFLIKEKIGGIESDNGSSFEFGGALGASYQVGGGFFGSARFTYGFTDALDDQDTDDVMHNSGFQIGIGLKF